MFRSLALLALLIPRLAFAGAPALPESNEFELVGSIAGNKTGNKNVALVKIRANGKTIAVRPNQTPVEMGGATVTSIEPHCVVIRQGDMKSQIVRDSFPNNAAGSATNVASNDHSGNANNSDHLAAATPPPPFPSPYDYQNDMHNMPPPPYDPNAQDSFGNGFNNNHNNQMPPSMPGSSGEDFARLNDEALAEMEELPPGYFPPQPPPFSSSAEDFPTMQDEPMLGQAPSMLPPPGDFGPPPGGDFGDSGPNPNSDMAAPMRMPPPPNTELGH